MRCGRGRAVLSNHSYNDFLASPIATALDRERSAPDPSTNLRLSAWGARPEPKDFPLYGVWNETVILAKNQPTHTSVRINRCGLVA